MRLFRGSPNNTEKPPAAQARSSRAPGSPVLPTSSPASASAAPVHTRRSSSPESAKGLPRNASLSRQTTLVAGTDEKGAALWSSGRRIADQLSRLSDAELEAMAAGQRDHELTAMGLAKFTAPNVARTAAAMGIHLSKEQEPPFVATQLFGLQLGRFTPETPPRNVEEAIDCMEDGIRAADQMRTKLEKLQAEWPIPQLSPTYQVGSPEFQKNTQRLVLENLEIKTNIGATLRQHTELCAQAHRHATSAKTPATETFDDTRARWQAAMEKLHEACVRRYGPLDLTSRDAQSVKLRATTANTSTQFWMTSTKLRDTVISGLTSWFGGGRS